MKRYMERKYYLRGLGIGIAVTAIIMGIAMSGNQTMTDEEVIARAKELGMVENTLLSDVPEEEQTEEDAVGEDAAEQKTADNSSGAGDGAAEQNDTGSSKDAENVTDRNTTDNAATEDNSTEGNKTEGNITGQTGEASVKDKEQEAENQDTGIEQETTGMTEEAVQSKLPGIEAAGNNAEDAVKTDKNEDITSAAIKTITVTSGDGSYTVAKKLADVGVVTSAENFDTYLCQNGYDKKLRTGTFSIPADASDEQIARIVTGAE